MIEDEDSWCQGQMFQGDRACSLGAMSRFMTSHLGDSDYGEVVGAGCAGLDILRRRLPAGERFFIGSCTGFLDPIAVFNDTHTHAEVVALFQKAIRVAKRLDAEAIAIPVEQGPYDAPLPVPA